MIASTAIGGGMADVAARIATIQTRIDAATGAGGATAIPVIDAPAGPAPARFAGSLAGVLAADPPGGVPATSHAPTSGPVATAREAADLAARLPEAGRAWAGAITEAAEAAGVDPALLAALVQHESGFDPNARSHAGALGLGQLMPGTARGLGVDPLDPEDNLAGAARYLRAQLDRFGAVDLALAAYNAGPNRVLEAGGVPRIPETLTYVDRVMTTWEQLR